MEEKIMIVDDAMFMRSVICKALAECGITDVMEAQDGETALKLYQEAQPDLVLLDITMPGKSGLEVLEEILMMNPRAKVVMCSAIGQEQVIQKAIIMGAMDFIVKPFKKDELQKIVKCALQR